MSAPITFIHISIFKRKMLANEEKGGSYPPLKNMGILKKSSTFFCCVTSLIDFLGTNYCSNFIHLFAVEWCWVSLCNTCVSPSWETNTFVLRKIASIDCNLVINNYCPIVGLKGKGDEGIKRSNVKCPTMMIKRQKSDSRVEIKLEF